MLSLVRATLGRRIRMRRQLRDFNRLGSIAIDWSRLRVGVGPDDLSGVFQSAEIAAEWAAVEREIAQFGISENAHGVNPGDRRAIYYLVRHYGLRRVLEVGTHVGASTIHIAAALRDLARQRRDAVYGLISVDVVDVNDPRSGAWLSYGCKHPPVEMVRRLGNLEHVSFLVGRSPDYLEHCTDRFDLIFLDGDHTPRTTYLELAAAARLLRPNGLILLHDVFPDLRPLWSDGTVIQGPWLAARRLQSEAPALALLPLGELPWPTKLGSRNTSLAILAAN